MIEKTVINTIKQYKVANKKEKIVVALSGGKDSTVVAYLLHKLGYNIEGFHINLNLGKYSNNCEKAVKKMCEKLKIKLTIYNFEKKHGSSMCFIRSAIQQKKSLKNCAICGVIKKWILNKEARKLKANKIATGHHLDDEAQTFFLNFLKGALHLSANTGPITDNNKNKKFITRIKPLFFCYEQDIKKYAKKHKLPVVFESCPCAIDSYRIQVRKYFKDLTKLQKKNIIDNFLRIKPKIKKIDNKIIYCQVCGEPARKRVCKKCELVRF